jgi:hypothetical protein
MCIFTGYTCKFYMLYFIIVHYLFIICLYQSIILQMIFYKIFLSQVLSCTLIIQELGKVKKKDFKFKLSLAHIGGPWLNPQSQKKK